jgi:protein TonB
MARQWQTVLVSVVAHVAAVFLLVVVPLLAFNGLPDLRSATEYVPLEMKIPDLPAAPRPARPATTSTAPASGPPLESPPTIGPEVVRPLPSIAAAGVPGGTDLFSTATIAPGIGVIVPPPVQKPPTLVRPGGNVKPPDRILNVRPDYPPMAIAARVSGSVVIEAIIGTDGVVREAKVLRSVPLLDDAALKAVRQWRYTPTLLNGVPVSVIMTVTVTFTLDR